MKNINAYLVGYRNSKKIISASAYLIKKYIPNEINTTFLNYGNFNGKTFNSNYEKLGNFRFGGADTWGKYLSKYFEKIEDEFLIFGLDDYFISKNLNQDSFDKVLEAIQSSKKIANVQLSFSSNQINKNYLTKENNILYLKRDSDYSAVTQWSIWRRSVLLNILKNIKSPWEFELKGSKILNKLNLNTVITDPPVLIYPDASALSSRNKTKVSILGIKKNDINELLKQKLIKEDNLILGHFLNKRINYIEYKDNLPDLVNYPGLDETEKEYINYILKFCLEINEQH